MCPKTFPNRRVLAEKVWSTITKERVRRPFVSEGSIGTRKIGMSSEALVSSADGDGRGEVGEEVRLDDESGARLAVLALERNGDQVASVHSRCSVSRALRCSAMSAAAPSSNWLSSGSARFAASAIAA